MENNLNNYTGRRTGSPVVLAQNLPWLPNWLPFSSLEPGRAEANLMALLGVARRILGQDYPE